MKNHVIIKNNNICQVHGNLTMFKKFRTRLDLQKEIRMKVKNIFQLHLKMFTKKHIINLSLQCTHIN